MSWRGFSMVWSSARRKSGFGLPPARRTAEPHELEARSVLIARAFSSEVDPAHVKKMRSLGRESRSRGNETGSRPVILVNGAPSTAREHRRLALAQGCGHPWLI